MRIVQAGRLFVLCGVISALLPVVQARAAVDAFMTVKGARQGYIKGNAMSEDIQLMSVVRDAQIGTGMGKRMIATITVTKKIDMASPKLEMASTSNEVLSEVAITFHGGSENAKTAQKILLKNATIVSIRKSAGYEQIRFDYRAIEVTYANGGRTMMDDWNTPK